MIKAVVDHNEVNLLLDGNGATILNDTARLVSGIYSSMARRDAQLGESYKNVLLAVLVAPDSSVWEVCSTDRAVLVDMAELKRQMEEGQ